MLKDMIEAAKVQPEVRFRVLGLGAIQCFKCFSVWSVTKKNDHVIVTEVHHPDCEFANLRDKEHMIDVFTLAY